MADGQSLRWWDQRIWSCMGPRTFLRLLRGRWRDIAPSRLPLVLAILLINAPAVALLSRLQAWLLGPRMRQAELVAPPVFIIGHHRSGTTFTHKLLSLVQGLHAPTAFECFGAPHFLLTGTWLPRWLGPFMATKRPMDAMPNDLAQPAEDDFALLAMGEPTPYLHVAFPKDPWVGPTEDEIGALPLLDAHERFLRALTLRHRSRLVLKSPYHTARIKALARRYPGARFLHVVRDLAEVGPSTLHMWQRFSDGHRLGQPALEGEDLLPQASAIFDWMYHRFFADRDTVANDAIMTVRYDLLIADPRGLLLQMLHHINHPAEDLQAVDRHLAEVKTYRTNRLDKTSDILGPSNYAARYSAEFLTSPE